MIIFNIENIRKAKNISLNQLHKLTGLSRSYLYDLENNRRTNLSVEVLEKIARVLNVNVKKLFYESVELSRLKKEMYRRINKYGINAPETLEISQIVDLFIVIDMKVKEPWYFYYTPITQKRTRPILWLI